MYHGYMVPNAGFWAHYCRRVYIPAIQGFHAGALEKVAPAFAGIAEEADAAAQAELEHLRSMPAGPDSSIDMGDVAEWATDHGIEYYETMSGVRFSPTRLTGGLSDSSITRLPDNGWCRVGDGVPKGGLILNPPSLRSSFYTWSYGLFEDVSVSASRNAARGPQAWRGAFPSFFRHVGSTLPASAFELTCSQPVPDVRLPTY